MILRCQFNTEIFLNSTDIPNFSQFYLFFNMVVTEVAFNVLFNINAQCINLNGLNYFIIINLRKCFEIFKKSHCLKIF